MNTITKTRINQVYRGYKLLHATYHDDIWTTNTYIAERGKIEPRIYKDMLDYRDRVDQRPNMDSIIDNPVEVERITAAVKTTDLSMIVTTENYNYNYNPVYLSYLIDKYGMENLLLEPLGKTSKVYAQNENGDTVAVLMGLRD